MPHHPQDKLSSLILIGFAALLGIFLPACVGTARIAQLVNQQVNDEGIARFEIDIHRSIFERELFRLCHTPPGKSKYECVPLTKSVEDGRFILTVDGKRHRVQKILWTSCILHESSRHCEKIDIAPTRERLSELKRAEQERIEREAEAERLEARRIREADEAARREEAAREEAAREEAAREQAAREEEERQRARDREELERAIREDRCTLFHHVKDEATDSYINVYECAGIGFFSGSPILVEKDGRILFRQGSETGDEEGALDHGPVIAIAEVRFSPSPHVDVITAEPRPSGGAHARVRFDARGAHELNVFGDDGEYSSFLDDYIYRDLRLNFSFIPNIVSPYSEPAASFASAEIDFDAKVNDVVCFGRPALWNEAELRYECHPEALAEFEKRQTERVREYLDQGDPARAFRELTLNTDDALKAEVTNACDAYYVRSLREVVRRRRQLDLVAFCRVKYELRNDCDEDELFEELFDWLIKQAFVCAPGSASVQKVVDDYHYGGLTNYLRGKTNTRRPGAAISAYFAFISPIKDPKLRAKAIAKLERSSPGAPLEIAIAQLADKGDVAGLRRQWSELFSPKGMDATTAAALRHIIDGIIERREHWWDAIWRTFNAQGFSTQMTIADARHKCAERKGRWESSPDRRHGACTLDGFEFPYADGHPATVALYAEDERSLPNELRIVWKGERGDRARLDALHEALLAIHHAHDLTEGIERIIGEASGAEGAPRAPRTLRTTTWNLGSRQIEIERATLNVEAGAESPESLTLILSQS